MENKYYKNGFKVNKSNFSKLSYPGSERDLAICCLSIHLVPRQGEISGSKHLDALLVANTPIWSKPFLSTSDYRLLKDAIRNSPLKFDTEKFVNWLTCISYLESRHAIQIRNQSDEKIISRGNFSDEVLFSLNIGFDAPGIARITLQVAQKMALSRKEQE